MVVKQISISMGAMLLIAIPWITTLSVHYGKFTWTAASGIALQWTLGHQHANFRYFHHPAEGRITSWEEPGELGVVDKIDIGLIEIAQTIDLNLFDIGGHLSSFNHFGLLFALTLIAFLWHRRERADRAWEPWRLGLVGLQLLWPRIYSHAPGPNANSLCVCRLWSALPSVFSTISSGTENWLGPICRSPLSASACRP
jgi:hypothetical protein